MLFGDEPARALVLLSTGGYLVYQKLRDVIEAEKGREGNPDLVHLASSEDDERQNEEGGPIKRSTSRLEQLASSAGISERVLKIIVKTAWFCGSSWALHFASKSIFEKVLGDRLENLFSPELAYLIPNKIVSTAHGVGVGLFAAYIVMWKRCFSKECFFTYPKGLDTCFSAMLGYNIYDLVTMYLGGDRDVGMWIHHILLFFGTSLEMVFRQGAFYPLTFTITEVTVLPSNILSLMKYLKVDAKYSGVFSAVTLFRVALYWLLRAFVGPYVVYHAASLGQLSRVFQMSNHPLVPFFLTFNVCVIGGLNMHWTSILTRNAIARFFSKV